jgi:subtilisin family serine protease
MARNFVPGEEYAAESHGTEVAGIIVARADNGLGMAGVAPQARLMALRACWQVAAGSARCSSFSLAQALQFAIHAKARVINLSLTGPRDELLSRLIDAALAQGSTVVAAVDAAAADGGFPASRPGVLAVASDEGACRVPGGLRAPGDAVPTTTPPSGWGMVSGASFAAAQVSGLSALMLQLAPALTPAQVAEALRASAAGGASAQAGRVDACSALSRAQPAHRCLCDCGVVAGQGN